MSICLLHSTRQRKYWKPQSKIIIPFPGGEWNENTYERYEIMKVYIRGLEKTSTLYLYGSGDDEVTEAFISKLGTSPRECEPVTDELRASFETDVDWTGVKYIMSEAVFNKFATTFERVQEVYDKLYDTAFENNMTADELCNYMIEKGIISEKEYNSFMCY